MRTHTAATLAILAFSLVALGTSPFAGADAAADAAAAEAQKAAQALVERIKSEDAAVKKAALADALKVQHPLVTAALGKALSDADEAIRSAALAALVARTDDVAKKAAATSVAARLERIAKKNEDYTERMKVIAALHDLAQPSSLKALAAETGLDVAPEEIAARMRAIANLPCKEAIDEIIQFRSSGRRGVRSPEGQGGQESRGRIAREAFAYAVGIDVGQDPDAMRKWWKEHEKGFDFAAASERRSREPFGGKAGDAKRPGK